MSLRKTDTNKRPPAIAGLRHVAFRVSDLERCQRFYVDLLGYQLEWQPDQDNVYLTCGIDNVALHRDASAVGGSSLDHVGIILNRAEDVDLWYDFLKQNKVRIKMEPKTHRDGARSFLFYDPEDNLLQMIYHPPIADQWTAGANKKD